MCVDFLMNAHHLFWMKIQHSNRIFQVSERCFCSPTQRIQSFQFFRRIFIHIQTCEYCFIISRCYFKPYNSEIYLIKPCLFRFFGVWRQKIKCRWTCNITIMILSLSNFFTSFVCFLVSFNDTSRSNSFLLGSSSPIFMPLRPSFMRMRKNHPFSCIWAISFLI